MPYDPHATGADPAIPVNTPTTIDGQVTLVAPDPAWPAMFAREAARIWTALGERAARIEHVGSTSVPGLIAKPCIDILLVVTDAGDDPAYIPDLQRAGYVLRISEDVDGWGPHRVFKGPEVNVNLHVLSVGSPEIARFLAFRDWLRTHPEDRERYAAAKRDLASRHWRHMQEYADAKNDVVREISARIRDAGDAPTRDSARLIGRIVRLQVQTAHLKRGEQPHRWYDPEPITAVATLRLDEGGVTGIATDGAVHHDVHHRDHPISRNRGDNGVSVGFTGHYGAMRERFGAHLTDGLAGENILIESDPVYSEESLGGTLLIETTGGLVRLNAVIPAPPCVEFTRFCLQWPRDRRPDRTVTEALQFLDGGMRAFYATFAPDGSDTTAINLGDAVYRMPPR